MFRSNTSADELTRSEAEKPDICDDDRINMMEATVEEDPAEEPALPAGGTIGRLPQRAKEVNASREGRRCSGAAPH